MCLHLSALFSSGSCFRILDADTDILHRDIHVLKTYGAAPYAAAIKKLEKQIKEKQTSVNEKIGVKVCSYSILWLDLNGAGG